MSRADGREVTLGVAVYLIMGASLALATFAGVVIVGQMGEGGLGAQARLDGAARDVLLAFFVAMPLVSGLVSLLVGARCARTGAPAEKSAAVAAAVGIPIAWFLVAMGLTLAGGLLSRLGEEAAFDAAFPIVTESVLYILALTAVGTAAAIPLGGMARDAFGEERVVPARPVSEPSAPLPAAAPVADADAAKIDCPRCGTTFEAAGPRPLRISCPSCGMTGTLR